MNRLELTIDNGTVTIHKVTFVPFFDADGNVIGQSEPHREVIEPPIEAVNVLLEAAGIDTASYA